MTSTKFLLVLTSFRAHRSHSRWAVLFIWCDGFENQQARKTPCWALLGLPRMKEVGDGCVSC